MAQISTYGNLIAAHHRYPVAQLVEFGEAPVLWDYTSAVAPNDSAVAAVTLCNGHGPAALC